MTELAIIAYLVANPERYKAAQRYLKKFVPHNPIMVYCWDLLQQCWNKHGQFPTALEAEWVFQQYGNGAGPQFQALIPQLVQNMYQPQYSGVTADMLGDLLIGLERERIQKEFENVKSLEDLASLQTEFDSIREALESGERTWVTPFADETLLANPLQFIRTMRGNPVPTGMPNFDAWLEGGFWEGELVTLIGLTGAGKSLLMLWWCLAAAMAGFRTFYFSFDNVMGELLSRVLCAVSGIRMDEEVTEQQYQRKIAIALEQFPALKHNFHIQKWPRGKNTIEDVERVLDQHEQHYGEPVKLGVLDYLNCIKPKGRYSDKRFGLDEVASDAAASAEERSMVWLSPLQSNRAGKGKEMDVDNAAEAWSMIWHASLAMVLCQDKNELHMNLARLLVGKARRVRKDYFVPVLLDPGTMRVFEDPNRPIAFRAQMEMLESQQNKEKRVKKEKAAERGVMGVPQIGQSWVAPMTGLTPMVVM